MTNDPEQNKTTSTEVVVMYKLPGRQHSYASKHLQHVPEALPRIYVFDNTNQHEWHHGIAIAEDGVCVAQHCSSTLWFCMTDMGMPIDATAAVVNEHARDDDTTQDYREFKVTPFSYFKHDLYKKHYPNGYILEWIPRDQIESHEGLTAAYKKNQELPEPANE